MKASSIACVLKSSHHNLVSCGAMQMGYYQVIATQIAGIELDDDILRKLSVGSVPALMMRALCIIAISEDIAKSLRKAYKHFQSIEQDKDFKLTEMSVKGEEEPLPPEVLKLADMDWLKNQIEGIKIE